MKYAIFNSLAVLMASGNELFVSKDNLDGSESMFLNDMAPSEVNLLMKEHELMEKGIMATKLLGQALVGDGDVITGNCKFLQGGRGYDLSALDKIPVNYGDETDADKDSKDRNLLFSFCHPVGTDILYAYSDQCKAQEVVGDRYGYLVSRKDDLCAPLTMDSNKLVTYEEIRPEDDKLPSGISMQFNPSDSECEGGMRSLKLTLFCDKSDGAELGKIDDIQWNHSQSSVIKECKQEVTMKSKSGCPQLDINQIWDFMDRYRFIFGGVFIAIGLFITLCGLRSIKPTVFVLSSVVVTAALLFTTFMLFVTGDSMSDVWGWIILVVCIILGLGAGFLLTKTIKLGVGLMGGATGFAIGLLIDTMFGVGSELWFWVICLSLAVAFFGLTFVKSNETIILITAMIGSYVWVRGVATMIPDSYPNEITVVHKLADGYPVEFPWAFWLYLGVMVASMVGGFWFQRKKMKESGAVTEHPYYAL